MANRLTRLFTGPTFRELGLPPESRPRLYIPPNERVPEDPETQKAVWGDTQRRRMTSGEKQGLAFVSGLWALAILAAVIDGIVL